MTRFHRINRSVDCSPNYITQFTCFPEVRPQHTESIRNNLQVNFLFGFLSSIPSVLSLSLPAFPIRFPPLCASGMQMLGDRDGFSSFIPPKKWKPLRRLHRVRLEPSTNTSTDKGNPKEKESNMTAKFQTKYCLHANPHGIRSVVLVLLIVSQIWARCGVESGVSEPGPEIPGLAAYFCVFLFVLSFYIFFAFFSIHFRFIFYFSCRGCKRKNE